MTSVPLPDTLTILPALPDFFVIDLLPLSDGSYHRERVRRTPVVGWQVENGNYVKPLIPSLPVTDRWAVLTPEGFVMPDEYTSMFAGAPLSLKNWIKSEIEYIEGPSGLVLACEYPPECEHVFEYGGPLAKAFGLLMARRREWTGTPKQLHKALSKFRDGIFVEMAGWPKGLKAFAAALKKLEPKLADADLFLRQSDDGRLVIYRQSGENDGGVLPLPFSRRTWWFELSALGPNSGGAFAPDVAAALRLRNPVQVARLHLKNFVQNFERSPFVQICMNPGEHSPSSAGGAEGAGDPPVGFDEVRRQESQR